MTQRGATLGIGHGRNHLWRLVQKKVAGRAGLLDHAPGGLDTVSVGIGLAAEFGDHDAVDGHLPAADQLFRVAARSDTRPRDDFLQTLL
jgi:hypothetical protein